MSEWKPGDVATWDGMGVALCIPDDSPNPRGITKWANKWGGASYYEGRQIRRLVVIDPEDADQVERIGAVCYDAIDSGEDLQAALREFAAPTPPKPDEPQGLGAVVEDAEGKRWVRGFLGDDLPWVSSHESASLTHRAKWGAVDAVRVLSEGVTP